LRSFRLRFYFGPDTDHLVEMTMPPNKSAAANSHRPFSFDQDMKFDHHHSIAQSTAGGCA